MNKKNSLSLEIKLREFFYLIFTLAPASSNCFFAVFASFTNLALSANSLGTKYLNEIFIITREVKDKISGVIQSKADYSELGILLIVVTLLNLIIPILIVLFIQRTKFKTRE